ncbi:YoaK family protein [Geodermatophilus sp. SYSU D00965]
MSASPVAAPSAPPAVAADRVSTGLRQALVVALAVVSGATDAIGLMALGGAFTSVMTGNLVILGVSASSADGALAIASGGAILAFCAGAALGVRLAGHPQPGDPVWPRRVTLALAVEFVLLAGYAVGWWVTGGEPGPVLTQVLLFTMALALGIQSSTVQRFGVPGMSTTYLTGTLTTVVMRLASGRGYREVRSSVEIILGLVAGAAAAAGLLHLAPPAAPVLQLAALGGVVAVAAVLGRHR